MRYLIALILMTSPALAHSDAGVHAHPSDGVWLAVMASVVAVSLMLRAALMLRAKVKVRK
ncbi:MAG: hypothetical protein ACRBCL_05895 [Maritimibacter sp.]